MGRPREFDIDKALAVATRLFWSQGYEGTSLAELTREMGITPPSFYFAFGSKEALFKQVLDRYQSKYLDYAVRALNEPTAKAVVESLLHGFADGHTRPGLPPGCLGVNSALPCAGRKDSVRMALADARRAARERLRERFDRARREGELPTDVEPEVLARFIEMVGWGMAAEAQAGATREELHRMAELALRAWPTSRDRAA